MPVERQQLERLIIGRQLLDRAGRELDRRGVYAEGLAVLSIHDAVEMVLRVVAERVKARLKPNQDFEGLIQKIEEATASKPIPFRDHLFRLNKLRVGFKHSGLLPREGDVRALYVYSEAAVLQVCEEFLGVQASEVSLAHGISDKDVRDRLVHADGLIAEGKHRECATECAIAWREIMGLLPRVEESRPPWDGKLYLPKAPDRDLKRALDDFARKVGEELSSLRSEMRFVIQGVDLREYRHFRAIVPHVNFTIGGQAHVVHRHGEDFYDREKAAFCVRFLVETALHGEFLSREG